GLSSGPFVQYTTSYVPLAVVPGTGLQVTVGGSNQYVFCAGRLVDNCPLTSFPVPNNGDPVNTRTDILVMQYAQTNLGSGVTRQFKNLDNTPAGSQLVYIQDESVAFNYLSGTSTVPSGWTLVATITVPANNPTQIVSGNIAMNLPTFGALLASLIGAGVASLNAQSGAVSIAGGTGITVAAAAGTITVTNAGVTSLNA